MNSLLFTHHGIYQLVRNPVLLDQRVDRVLVVAVVAEGIENLRQRQVRQVARDGLGENALSPQFDDGMDRRTCSLDDRLAAENGIAADDVTMSGCVDHFHGLSLRRLESSPGPTDTRIEARPGRGKENATFVPGPDRE
jgi:hypothetical protein